MPFSLQVTQHPVMPEFSHPERGFHHTVDSALAVLWGLGIPAERINIHMAGAGWPSHWVVDQTPTAGTPLSPDVPVSLSVAGLGFYHSLPVGFWDEGGEAEPGTKEIVGALDDPIQKQGRSCLTSSPITSRRASGGCACLASTPSTGRANGGITSLWSCPRCTHWPGAKRVSGLRSS